MNGWETVLAALGGILVGLGLGMALARRSEARLRREFREALHQIQTSVVPVLEDRAAAVGVPRQERSTASEHPLDLALALSSSIRRHVDQHSIAERELPFTDTVDIDPAALIRELERTS